MELSSSARAFIGFTWFTCCHWTVVPAVVSLYTRAGCMLLMSKSASSEFFRPLSHGSRHQMIQQNKKQHTTAAATAPPRIGCHATLESATLIRELSFRTKSNVYWTFCSQNLNFCRTVIGHSRAMEERIIWWARTRWTILWQLLLLRLGVTPTQRMSQRKWSVRNIQDYTSCLLYV